MTPLVNEPKRLRADAQRNRDRIVEAAGAVFAERGIEGQMDDVAARAKVGVGTVYRHFPTKDALLGALIGARFQTFAGYGREALEDPDAWGSLEAYLRRCAEDTAADAGLRHALQRAPQLFELCPAEQGDLAAVNEQLIGRAVKAGVVRKGTRGDDVGLIMAALCSAMGMPGKDWRRLMDLVLAGLRA